MNDLRKIDCDSLTWLAKMKTIFVGIILGSMACMATMPVVSITLGNKSISIYTVLIPVVFICLLLRERILPEINFSNKGLVFFLIAAIVATFVGVLYFENYPEFSDAAISWLPKILIYGALALLFASRKLRINEVRFFAYGLLIGAIVNLVWASLDGIIYYISDFSINNYVFRNYIERNNIRLGMMSLDLEIGFRATGFNYDPAHIGMMAPFVYAFALRKKKYFFVLLTIVALIMSQSMTGVIGCVLVTIYIVLNDRQKETVIFLLSIVAIMMISGIILIQTQYSSVIYEFSGRLMDKVGSDSVETARIIYNTRFFEAACESPISFIIGTGFGTASYPFAIAGLADLFPFDPETTYISYLFDTGIVGVIIFILYLFKAIRTTEIGIKKNIEDNDVDIIISSGLVAMLFVNLFYHYTLYATHMIVFFVYIAKVVLDNCMNIEREKEGCFMKGEKNSVMNSITKTSVLLTTYNGEKYILELLTSLFNQTRKIDEVIIFDDGSNDKTLEIVRNFIKRKNLSNWIVHENKENKGWRRNFWEGFSFCTGNIIFPCDQDDIWEPEKVEKMTKCMEENTNIKLLVSNYKLKYEENSIHISKKISNQNNDGRVLRWDIDNHFMHILRPGCCFAFRKDLYDKIKNYWTEEDAHDAVLWRYSIVEGSLYNIREELITFRRHNSNSSSIDGQRTLSKDIKNAMNYVCVLEKLNDFNEQTQMDAKVKKIINELIVFHKKRLELFQSKRIIKWSNIFFRYHKNYLTKRSAIGDLYVIIKR